LEPVTPEFFDAIEQCIYIVFDAVGRQAGSGHILEAKFT
jgi:hypothetical protein